MFTIAVIGLVVTMSNNDKKITVPNFWRVNGGAGLINVPLDKWDKWNELIAAYHRTNDMTKIKKWTYDNAIQGLDVQSNK